MSEFVDYNYKCIIWAQIKVLIPHGNYLQLFICSYQRELESADPKINCKDSLSDLCLHFL